MQHKKIALVVDVADWAFDIQAKLLQKKLNHDYIIDIFYANDEKYHDDLYLILEDTKNYDLIHFFWRKTLLQFLSEDFKEQLKQRKIDYQQYLNQMKKKISFGIYDHLFLESDNVALYLPVFKECSKQYYTCSKRLETIYQNIKDYPNPWGTIYDSYDNDLYYNMNLSRYEKMSNSDPLIIGWVGNSKWNIKYKDFKGFHSILEPVVDELIQEGYNIQKHYADKNIQFRKNNEMPSYYQEIDICIVVSIIEGTPRPIIEAMAAGVPVITTDVGVVPEVLGEKQKQFIIGNRQTMSDEQIKNVLKEKIIYLYNNRNILKELALENYERSAITSIDHLYLKYKKYFDDFFIDSE